MLGEIIKSTEALRYHAKSAEIAGKNLAHVNDENYARQRVLAREGLMYNGQGGLNTSSIEAGGLDHARNELIDKRLFNEFGQTASLEAQQEILKLLQSSLGEKIDRQSIDGGLDDLHDSNLSAGGLARAMDDLFNAFQELSASPDTKVASQEVFNKINTLTKRINDAGIAIDEIDADLNVSISGAVDQVNRILNQVHEVNIQIRRFELLGQGKAVTYRDQRQKLLEDLSKLIDFKTSPELNASGVETGFLNIFTKDSTNRDLVLVDSKTGVHRLINDSGKSVYPSSVGTDGTGLQINTKVSEDGKLGFVEVIDGGSNYNDSDGPLLLTFTPPLQGDFNVSIEPHEKFSYFEQDGIYYQALEKVPTGISLTDPKYFSELKDRVSLLPYKKGDFFKQEGVFYRALSDMPSGSLLSDKKSFKEEEAVNLVTRSENSFFEESNQFFKVFSELEIGLPLSNAGSFEKLTEAVSLKDRSSGEIFEQGGKYYQIVAEETPVTAGTPLTDPAISELDPADVTFSLGDHSSGEIFEQGGKYFRIIAEGNPVVAGTPLTDPAIEELDPALSWNNYSSGEIFEQGGKFYKTIADETVPTGALLSNENFFKTLDPATFSVEDRKDGDFFEQDGVYYKSLSDFNKGTSLAFSKVDPVNTEPLTQGAFLEQGGNYYRVLENVETGTPLDSESFELISEPVSLVDYSSGDIIKQEGGYYEVLKDIPAGTPLSDKASFFLKTEPVSTVAHEKGSFFSQNGKFYQALDNIPSGTPLSIATSFVEIDPRKIPSNGDLTAFPETLRRFSDLETFKSGDQIYFEGDFYHARNDINPVTIFDISENQNRDFLKGEVLKIGDTFYQLEQDVGVEDVDRSELISKSIKIGDSLPRDLKFDELWKTDSALDEDFYELTKSYDKNNVFKLIDQGSGKWKYFQVQNQLLRGNDFTIKLVDPSNPTDSDWKLVYNRNGEEAIFASEIDDDPTLGYSVNVYLDGLEKSTGIYKKGNVEINVVIDQAQSVEGLKLNEKYESPIDGTPEIRFVQDEIYYTEDIEGNYHHFIVTDTVLIESDPDFNAFDEQWSGNFRFFTPQLVDEKNPELFFKRAHPKGYYEDIEKESLVKLNIGTAEAVVNNGEITGFNILGTGSNLPKSDSVFVQGKEILVSSGSIHGYQSAKSNHLNKFREELNSLVANLVDQINSIYNETDSPGEYLFGFDAVLGRPITGRNSLMEETFGLFGREGDATLKLYRDEVSMRLPFAESENYNIFFSNEIYPDDFLGVRPYARSSDETIARFTNPDLDDRSAYDNFELDAVSSRRLGTPAVPLIIENDPTDPGDDKIFGNGDDGKSYLMTHEAVPFLLEVDNNSKLPVVGDNYSFKAFLSNPWNLATSLRVQNGLSVDSIVKNKESNQESNDFALKIAELASDGLLEDIALLNSNLGNALSNIDDNLEHQQSIENVLLDQRRAVSSVSIDEEVADLMRFQRSFQASSRVLNTLDKMLEIVVMGLVK